MLVLWTPAARDAAGGEEGIRAAIDLYAATTNDALRNSGTTLQVRLVGAEQVEYVEELGHSSVDLERLREPQDGFMDEVDARRNALGADLVNLITNNTDVGGIAFLMHHLSLGFASHAFSVVTYSQVSYFAATAFAHELGHNMGLDHDRFVSADGGLFAFSHGYVNALAFEFGAAASACWRTIMAYPSRCTTAGLDGVKVPYFSTPLIRYPDEDGDPLGVHKTSEVGGPDGPADAVRSLEEARFVVANFRSEHTDDGDAPDQATTVAASSVTIAELGRADVDFFRIELPTPGALRVESTGEVDTVGTLMDEVGDVLASDDDSGARLNFLIEHDMTAGVYFVKVEGFKQNDAGPYTLVTSFHPLGEADDHGDTSARATTVAATSVTEAALDGANDVDYFRFELRERGALEVKTSGSVDTLGTLSRVDDPFLFTYHQEEELTPPQGGTYTGGGVVASEALSDDDSGPGGNFKIVGKFDPGTYHVAVRGWDERARGATPLQLSFDPATDDHGDRPDSASAMSLPGVYTGELEVPLDLDYFRIEVAEARTLRLGTEGRETDTWGTLTTAGGTVVARNDDQLGNWPNFGIFATLEPGVYFLEVTGWYFSQGPYVLEASFAHAASIPLFTARGHATRQGFARIVNRSDRAGTVTIYAIDDGGARRGPLSLDLRAYQARHINSEDLERGNRAGGLIGQAGDGQGNWRLELYADVTIEALAYVRTRDGFLTSIHDVVPAAQNGAGRRYRVAIFNPASNRNQVSKLRLANPGVEAVDVAIQGVDDRGFPAAEGEVELTLAAGASRTLTAHELEAGAADFDGRLGDGSGKWELTVNATAPILAMSLLENPTGHLTNLSSPASRMFIPLFMAAGRPHQHGFLRVMNRSNEAGRVTIQATDDSGFAAAPVTLRIGARSVRYVNSDDLESGASAKGLSGGVGRPTAGNWRLELSTSLADVDAYSYVRTMDGFLASMHDLVPNVGRRHEVATFNPGGNVGRASRLRLINPGSEEARVVVRGVDDDGAAGATEVAFVLAAGHSKEITAAQLEAGGAGFDGRLGDGAGKWRLAVTADQTIHVMNLLEAKTGDLTNLSTGGTGGGT